MIRSQVAAIRRLASTDFYGGTIQSPYPLVGEGVGRGGNTAPEFARYLCATMTASESRLWHQLRAHRFNGEKFRCYQPIGPYVADFVHFGTRLIIEIDGGQHNGAQCDEVRDAWLYRQGFRVLRFWNNEVMNNLTGVLEMVKLAVESAPSPQAPPPPRGRAKLMIERIEIERT